MDSSLPESNIISPDLQPVQSAGNIPTKKGKLPLIIGGAVILMILVGMGGYYFLKMKNQSPPQVSIPPPAPAIEGAKFLLQADPQEASLGGQIKLTVLVKSDLDAANLFIAKLKFSNQFLQAKSISLRSEATSSGFIKDWFISNWVENTIDNNTGSVSLVGGVPNPGFQTPKESSGSAMADVIFTAKAPGETVISFDDTSAVYRNSDNANILVGKTGTTIKITGELPAGTTPSISSPPVEVSPTAAITTPGVSLTPSPTPSGLLEGDVNQDGEIDLRDLSSLLSFWGKTGTDIINADLNKDGRINAFDYSRLTVLLKDSKVIQ